MAHSIIHLYVHFNISVIRLVVITQVISHTIAGHQGLPSVRAKLTNTFLDAYEQTRVCYRPHSGKQKNDNFYACHHSLSCVHKMHHRSNTNVGTHSLN